MPRASWRFCTSSLLGHKIIRPLGLLLQPEENRNTIQNFPKEELPLPRETLDAWTEFLLNANVWKGQIICNIKKAPVYAGVVGFGCLGGNLPLWT